MIRAISRALGHHFRAFRRAAAQKQRLISGAKHSPPTSSDLVAQGAEIQGFSSLRDIEHFNLKFDYTFIKASSTVDLRGASGPRSPICFSLLRFGPVCLHYSCLRH